MNPMPKHASPSPAAEPRPRFLIDASRSWPDMVQSRDSGTLVRTVLGPADMRWAFRVAARSAADCEIELIYDGGSDCGGVGYCLWRECAEQVVRYRLTHRVDVRYVGDADETSCCMGAHIAALTWGRPVCGEPVLSALVRKYR